MKTESLYQFLDMLEAAVAQNTERVNQAGNLQGHPAVQDVVTRKMNAEGIKRVEYRIWLSYQRYQTLLVQHTTGGIGGTAEVLALELRDQLGLLLAQSVSENKFAGVVMGDKDGNEVVLSALTPCLTDVVDRAGAISWTPDELDDTINRFFVIVAYNHAMSVGHTDFAEAIVAKASVGFITLGHEKYTFTGISADGNFGDLSEWVKEPPKEPELKTYQIWAEGYDATGQSNTAQLLGTQQGVDFAAAVRRHVDTLDADSAKYYNLNASPMTRWGCRLFDNEADARKSYG